MGRFSREFMIFSNADRTAERIFLAFTVLFITFIVFTSCFHLSPPKYKLKPNVFLQLFSAPSLDYAIAHHDLQDIAANVLFYIPLGLFLSLTVSFRNPVFVSPWLLTGFLLSVAMEMTQYFIGRYPDVMDILTNTTGFIFGFEVGVAAIKYFGLRPAAVLGINPDNQTSTRINTIAAVRFLYIAIYLLSSLLPFDVTFDPHLIMAKFNPDKYGHFRIILDPMFHFRHWKHDGEILNGIFLGLLPVGILTAVLNGFQKRLNWVTPILMCLLTVMISELGQLLIISRTTDIAMIPLAFIAGACGWVVARVWFMMQDHDGYSSFENERHRNEFLFSLTAWYAAYLVVATLAPFRFEFSLKAVLQKMLYQSNLVPFANQIGMRNMEMTFWLLRDMGAFILLGLLLTFLIRVLFVSVSRARTILIVGCAGLLFGSFLEALKLLGVGRYADITSVILACLGAIIGGLFFRFLSRDS